MKYTLKEMVDLILSSMDSDEVNDITDTAEAQQVVQIIRFVYGNMVADLNLPEHFGLFELTASGDNTQPTIMTLPSNVIELRSIKYNNILSTETDPQFLDVHWMQWNDFSDLMQNYNTDNTNMASFTRVINGDNITFKYINDKMPQWFSSFDDGTLVFDSYDADEDTTLQSEKTQCYGQLEPTFTESNNFTPDLDSKQFAFLVNEAKSLAFAEMKQTTHAKAEQMGRRNKITMQRSKERIQPFDNYNRLPNYGRK